MTSSENIYQDNIEEQLQRDMCELGFQHDRHEHCNAPTEKKGEKKRVGGITVKKQ
jgi:hypothetical protein